MAERKAGARERLLEAALALFSQRGFDGATTAEIARRAQVTEKTLFAHFRSKQALYKAVADPALLAMVEPLRLERLRELLSSPSPTFPEAVRALARERLAFAQGAPETLKLVAQELLLGDQFRAPLITYWTRTILPGATQLIERARRRKELRQVPTATVLRALVSLVVSLALEMTVLAPQEEERVGAELEAVLDVFLHGVLAAKDPPPARRRGRRKHS